MKANTFRNTLNIQIRVLNALLRRELVSLTGKKGSGFLFLAIEPLLFVLALGGIFFYRSSIGNIPLPAFIFSGYCIMFACRFHAMKISGAYSSNRSLLYHRYVKITDLFISRSFIQIFSSTFSSIILLLFLMFSGWVDYVYDPPSVMFSWILVQWFGVSLSLICGSISSMFAFGSKITLLLAIMQTFTTGAFFMVDWLPEQYQEIVLYLPMVHATEMMRYGFFGDIVRTHYEIIYVIVLNIILTYIGLTLCRVCSVRGDLHDSD